jgi:AraC-like DNA-binding protein
MQFPASPVWSFCIKHYLFLKCRNGGPLRLFSDGNTGMVFILSGQLKIRNKENSEAEFLPEAFIYGQVDRYHDIFSCDNTELLIVVFQPYGYFSLSGIPADELKAAIFDAYLIFGRGICSLTDALRSGSSYLKSISLIESYFAGIHNTKAASRLFNPVANTIIHTKGQLTVSELIRLTGYPERKLERLFHEGIGLSPLKYIQIVRLHHFLSIIRSTNKPISLTIAGLESGYYDQPHLIHNFKQITGLTPTQYLSATGTLAVNLVMVN